MAFAWRIVVFFYSLLLLAFSSVVIIAAIGRPEPLEYITFALSTPTNRIYIGLGAIILLAIAILSLIYSLKTEKVQVKQTETITVQSNLTGQVSITVQALKVIIMRAIKTVDGVKEVKSNISHGAQGLAVQLHIMIDPELSVPKTTKEIQEVVKKYIEETGGLPVEEIKVLVDDFGTNNLPTSK